LLYGKGSLWRSEVLVVVPLPNPSITKLSVPLDPPSFMGLLLRSNDYRGRSGVVLSIAAKQFTLKLSSFQQ